MTKWEYKVVTGLSNLEGTKVVEQSLNKHGSEGWELVNIIPQYTTSTNGEDQVNAIYVQTNAFVYKRPIE